MFKKARLVLKWILIIPTIIISLIYGINSIINNNLFIILNNFLIIPIIILPILLKKISKFKINYTNEMLYIIFIFLSYFLGSILNFYDKFNNYDTFIHFISGILTSYLALLVLKKFNLYDPKNLLFNIVFIFSITMLIASIWEVYEYITDKIFDVDSQLSTSTGINDTMYDIIAAMMGAIVYSCIYGYNNKIR